MRNNSREVRISKKKLISKIKSNKKLAYLEYVTAKELFKQEAAKQLKEVTERLVKGDISNIELDLVKPVNNHEHYERLIELFTWELDDEVILTQSEFLEYVRDETQASRNAKFLNTTYLHST